MLQEDREEGSAADAWPTGILLFDKVLKESLVH